MKTNSCWSFICEGWKQSGCVFAAFLLLGGVGWLGAASNSVPDMMRILSGLTALVSASILSGPIPILLTHFDITNKQLFIFWGALVIPYWVCLGVTGGFLRWKTSTQVFEQKPLVSLNPNKKYTRWTIEIIAVVLAIISFPGGPIAGPSFVSGGPSIRNSVINKLRQIDAAKNQLALEEKLSPDYVPTKAELAPYLYQGTNFFNLTSGPIRYILNPINKSPYAVLDSDWRFPRRGWREGHTITNGTVFQLP
jgi:hypothetical protein